MANMAVSLMYQAGTAIVFIFLLVPHPALCAAALFSILCVERANALNLEPSTADQHGGGVGAGG